MAKVESKFLFISKFFIFIFIVINTTYLIPFNIFNVNYYIDLSTIIVDTATLLTLGLAIPKFTFLKHINQLKESSKTELDKLNLEKIDALESKNFQNKRLSYISAICFLIITLMQPLNLVFLLNENDRYSSLMVKSINNKLKMERLQIPENYNSDMSKSSIEEDIINTEKQNMMLQKIAEKNINVFLEENNKSLFIKIKFIIRNLIMALLWSILFYKLSRM